MRKTISNFLILIASKLYRQSPELGPGILIITHRTPEAERLGALIQSYQAFWHQLDANHCLQVEFSYKLYYDSGENEPE